MRVIDIVRGVAAGYGLKIVQMLATLLVVPFLLQDEVLGLDDYGRIFAILGLLSPVSLLTDGLRASFSRSIAKSLADSPADVSAGTDLAARSTGREIGSAVKMIAVVTSIVAAALFLGRSRLLELIAVPVTPDYMAGFAFAIAFVTSESFFFIVMSHLNARGRMDVVNGVQAVETITRNLFFVAWFSTHGASVSMYFGIFVLFALIKSLALLSFGFRRWPWDFTGFWSGRLSDAGEAVRYSVSISTVTVNFFVFQRLTIPLVARFIGPAEAGLLALGVNTIANSLSQMLFNVVHPLLVPIASRIRFDRLSEVRARLLLNLDAIYALLVGVVTIPIIAAMPTLVTVWLGPEKSELIVPAQILVAGSGLTIGFNMRHALMVGQGLAGRVARVVLVTGALGLVGLYWALIVEPNWVAVAGVIATVTAVSSTIGVGLGFDRAELVPGTRRAMRGLRMAAMLLVGIVSAYFLSSWAPLQLELWAVVPPILSALIVLATGHLLLIPLPDVYDTLATIRSGADRQIFDDGADERS